MALLGGLLLALTAAPIQATGATPAKAPAADGSGTVMVLDSSGSMAEDDGSGSSLPEALNSVRAGGTPIGLSLRKAAGDLPRSAGGSIGKHTSR